MRNRSKETCITASVAIVIAILVVPPRALAGNPTYNVEHNLTDDMTFPMSWPDPPSGFMMSTNAIFGFASSDSGSATANSFNSQAVLNSSAGELSISIDLSMASPGGSNVGSQARGDVEWVADDLVFTSTNGQTGSVQVQLRGELCVSHGGTCTHCPPFVCGSCPPPCPGCVPPQATGLSAARAGPCCPPDFLSFSFSSVPQGCIDVTGQTRTVQLGQTITWGPLLHGQVATGAGLNGGVQTSSVALNARLRFGDLQPDGSIGPAFILPPNVTVNALSIGLIDNYFQPAWAHCPANLTGGQGDLGDFAYFAGCMSGPEQPLALGCEPADVDGDGDADMDDFGVFQAAFGCP